MINESNVGDFLYEQERDDKDIKKMEKAHQNQGDDEFEVCMYCGKEFDLSDLDKHFGEWTCRECQERLENEK